MSTCPACNGSGVVGERTEFWVVQSEGFGMGRALAYWGPYRSEDEAKASGMYRPEWNCVVIEVPA